ncbi:acriflavin resistance protein [Plesiocystis pacifica SIR-1]|uniref:Acriflavin resistance protein n=1 Tax=Plesiocystis pacifica SIR-1 TaxID=391625 RepID=A6G7K1_9BACT|nr:efflux RND transporter permease subunit [Plesiocystis pacifica]EDM78210.1 acriflavin resistance protein [Plesiocystis pacifica SIR-1]
MRETSTPTSDSPDASEGAGAPQSDASDAPDAQAAQAAEKLAVLSDRLRAMDRFRFTVTRPVAVLMVFFAVIVFGAFSATSLPVNLMPDISYPKLTVRTEYEGAAPAEVENDVARPLEEVLGVVTGVTRISSVSRAGYADVILEFTWDMDMGDANQDVLEKLDVIKSALPEESKAPLILRYDPTLDPVLVLSLSGEGEAYEGVAGLKALRRVADREVRRLLEPVDGVASVKVRGGLEEEIHVELDEDALRRTGISSNDVISRLSAENINLAGGSMREGRTRYLIRTVNEFRDLDDIRDLVVASRNGRDVLLRHIATIEHGFKDREVITRIDGSEAVMIEVYKEADANIVEMAKQVRERIDGQVAPKLAKEYDTSLGLVSDRSLFIQSSIAEVRNTAIVGGLFAILVLFLFLREGRSTVIVAASIPVSILVTFAPLKLAGVSLNIMSLGGMALGIGMLVDNSIVVLESIHRCREEGDPLVRATLRGVSEVGSAVVASTLTSIAVFFPMIFVEGVAGQMFGDLGLTVVFSLLASLAVALFLIPMLASRQLPGGESPSLGERLRGRWLRWTAVIEVRELFAEWAWWRLLFLPYYLVRFVLHLALELVAKVIATVFGLVATAVVMVFAGVFWALGWVVKPVLWAFDKFLDVLGRIYAAVIRWSLRHSITVLGVAALALSVMAGGATRLDTELIPEVHQAEFTIELSFPVGTPIDETDRLVEPLEEALRERVPHLRAMVTSVGSERDSDDSSERGEHTSKIAISLLAGGGQQRAAAQSQAQAQGEAGEDGEEGEAKVEAPSAMAALLSPAAAEAEALAVVREVIRDIPDLETNISRPVLFSFKTPVEVEIRGHDLEELAAATEAVRARLEGIEGLRDVKASIQPGNPEVQIIYDRDALARLGLDIRQVAELVRDKVQGQEATKFNRQDRKVPIRVRVEGMDQANVEELRNLAVNPSGVAALNAITGEVGQTTPPIPLSAVADIKVGRGPNEIRRIGQQRVGLVTANVEGVGLGTAATEISAAIDGLELPAGVKTAVTGQSEEWETSSRSLYLALALSVFLVYVIMASQFESLIYPLIILVSIPLAFVGVVVVLLALDMPISVIAFLGAIMLAGIVVNNAIVLVDYVNQLKARGHATAEALEMAGTIRLRPILMTTLTTVLGLIPMAAGMGDGAEIRQPMAITVIAGLSFSTLLTLIVIPTLYQLVDRLTGERGGSSPAEQLERELAELDRGLLVPEMVELAQTQAADANADADAESEAPPDDEAPAPAPEAEEPSDG